MTTYKYWTYKKKNTHSCLLFLKMYDGKSYRLLKVEGGILMDPAGLWVLCLIQVLTLVVCTWTAVDCGHAGRDKWQLEVTLFACAGVVQVWMTMSLGAPTWLAGGFCPPGSVLQSKAGRGAFGCHGGLFFSSWCADFHSPESEKNQQEDKFSF